MLVINLIFANCCNEILLCASTKIPVYFTIIYYKNNNIHTRLCTVDVKRKDTEACINANITPSTGYPSTILFQQTALAISSILLTTRLSKYTIQFIVGWRTEKLSWF